MIRPARTSRHCRAGGNPIKRIIRDTRLRGYDEKEVIFAVISTKGRNLSLPALQRMDFLRFLAYARNDAVRGHGRGVACNAPALYVLFMGYFLLVE